MKYEVRILPVFYVLYNFQVHKLCCGEVLMLLVGSLCCGGRIIKVKSDMVKIVLSTPVCAEVGDKLMLCRRIDRHWR